jgi:hypothetical protein
MLDLAMGEILNQQKPRLLEVIYKTNLRTQYGRVDRMWEDSRRQFIHWGQIQNLVGSTYTLESMM